jgi:hypothetical protein
VDRLTVRRSSRFGGGAAYVLSDETLRGQVIRYAMQTYGSIAQSVEELKEHLAGHRHGNGGADVIGC